MPKTNYYCKNITMIYYIRHAVQSWKLNTKKLIVDFQKTLLVAALNDLVSLK